jgi:hypothetical protein
MDLTELPREALLRCSRVRTRAEMVAQVRTLDQTQVGGVSSVPTHLPVQCEGWPDRSIRTHQCGFESRSGDGFD